MNIFSEEMGKISKNHFGLFFGGEYLVAIKAYEKTPQPEVGRAFVDGYYEVSNSQYHLSKEFLNFCTKFGCKVEVEREKSYKDFLWEAGFFQRGKNTLLQDREFGSKIYFSIFKVLGMPVEGKRFCDYFPSESECVEYFLKRGYQKEVAIGVVSKKTRLEFVKFLQIEKSKQSRYRSIDDGCGSCKLCLEACPQGAIPCNLENCLRNKMQEGIVEVEYSQKLGARVLGCEICSAVCPKNSHIPESLQGGYELSALLGLVEKKDRLLCEKYGKNIISKPKLIPFILNAMGNSGLEKYLEILEKYSLHENENIASSAKIAREKLKK